jgi:hypothetical protein
MRVKGRENFRGKIKGHKSCFFARKRFSSFSENLRSISFSNGFLFALEGFFVLFCAYNDGNTEREFTHSK